MSRGKPTRERAEYRFTRLPREFGARWYGPDVSTFQRGLALQIVAHADGLEWPCDAEHWEAALCRALEARGPERPNILRALRAMLAVGLLEHTGEALRVRIDLAVTPPKSPRIEDCGETVESDVRSQSGLSPVSVRSHSGPNPVSVRSQSDHSPASVRSHPDSGQPSENTQDPFRRQTDRQTEKTERESARVRECAHASAREGSADPLDELDETARAFAVGYESRYLLAHDVPVTWSPANLAAAQSVGTWLGRLRTGTVDANVRRLLEGWFRNPFGKLRRHSLEVLAKGPEEYFERARSSGDYGYEYASQDFGPPTDLSELGPLPPREAAE